MKSSRGSGGILDQVSVSPTSVSQMVELENDQICLDSLANVVEDMAISVEQVQGGSNGGSGVAPSGCKTADQEDLGSSGDGANAMRRYPPPRLVIGTPLALLKNWIMLSNPTLFMSSSRPCTSTSFGTHDMTSRQWRKKHVHVPKCSKRRHRTGSWIVI